MPLISYRVYQNQLNFRWYADPLNDRYEKLVAETREDLAILIAESNEGRQPNPWQLPSVGNRATSAA